MKKLMIALTITAMLMPVSGFAMKHMEGEDHGKMDMKHEGMEHGDMKDMDHGDMKHEGMEHGSGMSMGGDMIMLKDQEVDGVMGSAHLMDVKEKMAKYNMPQTHHFMVGFMDNKGDEIKEGTVAIKITGPDGKESDPIKLMAMDGMFGSDVTLDKPGMYHIMVGTKLADGQKRTFMYMYDNK